MQLLAAVIEVDGKAVRVFVCVLRCLTFPEIYEILFFCKLCLKNKDIEWPAAPKFHQRFLSILYKCYP